mgnify:CR=1 FL=1
METAAFATPTESKNIVGKLFAEGLPQYVSANNDK